MSWDVERLKAELQKFSDKVGDTFDAPVAINGRLTRTLGRVISIGTEGNYHVDRVEFSRQLLETSSEKSIIDVIGHEWAHYYVIKTTGEKHDHDAFFKATCAKVGCTNDQARTEVERTVAHIAKYEVWCGGCGNRIGEFSRMCKTLRQLDSCTCGKCGSGDLEMRQNW